MTSWGGEQTPAGARADRSAAPAGTSGSSEEERAAQRETWGRVQASYRRGKRRGGWQRRAARGTLPDQAGLIRRPPPDGDDAA